MTISVFAAFVTNSGRCGFAQVKGSGRAPNEPTTAPVRQSDASSGILRLGCADSHH
ncbi:MAG TPA: hypothetical protein VFI55_10220 [Mycobacterium sp.]|nr:hypothetical protein [Mycobacterium sp.]